MKPRDRTRGGFIPLSHRYRFDAQLQDPYLGYKLHLIAIGATKDGGWSSSAITELFAQTTRERHGGIFRPLPRRHDARPDPVHRAAAFRAPRVRPCAGSALDAEPLPASREAPRPGHHRRCRSYPLFARRRRDVEQPGCRHAGMGQAQRALSALPGCKLVLITRSWGEASRDADGNARYVQLWSETGWPPLKSKFTNIRSASQDTCDIDYNPVTKRLEVIHPNRRGAGPGQLNNARCRCCFGASIRRRCSQAVPIGVMTALSSRGRAASSGANRTPLTACTLPQRHR